MTTLRRIYQQTRDLYHAHRRDESIPLPVIEALRVAAIEAQIAWNDEQLTAQARADVERVKRVAAVLREALPPDRAEERARNILMATSGGERVLDAARACLVGHWSLAAYTIPSDLPERVAAVMEAT